MKRGLQLKHTYLLFIIMLAGFSAFARTEPVQKSLEGWKGQLAKDSVLSISDPNSGLPGIVLSRKCFLTLRINEGYGIVGLPALPDSFKASIGFVASYLDSASNQQTIADSIVIAYHVDMPNAIVIPYELGNLQNLNLTINQVSINGGNADPLMAENIIKNLSLDVFLNTDRFYEMSCTNPLIDSLRDFGVVAGELPVAWNMTIISQAGNNAGIADEYDLEWAWVDQLALDAGNYNKDGQFNLDMVFANNASRVTLAQSSYKIPLLYDDNGVLFYRVRPVQYDPVTKQRKTGVWSAPNTNENGQCNFSFNGHERNLNWQATTSFAEDGKRKSVVQYFDGLQKARQTVTKDNVSGKTIVAETLYDRQGRPAIQVLPAPTLNNTIGYTPLFTQGINGAEFDFDNAYNQVITPTDFCNAAAPPMGTTSGAAAYYSPANQALQAPNDPGVDKFIPDAAGYPYTETRYAPDNTGRIAAQSGVGPEHQLNSGHATNYYYGNPSQVELDALFGTDAGFNNFYQKTMVKDANGQYSVSITDMTGKTIATALAGPEPAGLNRLENYLQQTIEEQLISTENTFVEGYSIVSKSTLLNTLDGLPYEFKYLLKPETLNGISCVHPEIPVCYDCLYDLNITITTDCNNSGLPGNAPVIITRNNIHVAGIDTTCATSNDSLTVAQTINLPAGAINITKRLTVSQASMDLYRQIYLQNNACKSKEDFIAEWTDSIGRLNNCALDCDGCKLLMKTDSAAYELDYLVSLGFSGAEESNLKYRQIAAASYTQLKKECIAICDGYNDADNIREQMLADVSPGGQFAQPSLDQNNAATYYGGTNDLNGFSVLRIHTGLVSNPYNYKVPTDYKDEEGLQAQVTLNGSTYSPQQLSEEDFINNFQSSWAESLLRYHPEYDRLLEFEKYRPSHLWNEKFENTESYTDAASTQNGFINPLGATGFLSGYPALQGYSLSDPLFTAAVTPYSSLPSGLNSFMGKLQDFKLAYNNTAVTVNLWQFVNYIVRFGSSAPASQSEFDAAILPANVFSSSYLCPADLQKAWEMFRSLYLNAKKDFLNGYIQTTATKPPNLQFDMANYHSYFITNQSVQNFLGTSSISSEADATALSNSQLAAQKTDVCTSYAKFWWEQLAPCGIPQTDSAMIINQMIAVCEAGFDVNHPFGASTVAPSGTYPPGTPLSFAAIIENWAATHGVDPLSCNVSLIKGPKPYEIPAIIANKPILQSPSACECNRLNDLKSEADTHGYTNNLSGYLQAEYKTAISQSDLLLLLGQCNNPDPSCLYLPHTVNLPPSLQCLSANPCLDCATIKELKDSFVLKYNCEPSIDPGEMFDLSWDSVGSPINPVTLYSQTFDNGTQTYPYTGAGSISKKLAAGSWTNNLSTPQWNYYPASAGNAIGIATAAPTSTSITFTAKIDAGYVFNVSAFSFDQRSSYGGYSNWVLYINGAVAGSGLTFLDEPGLSSPLQQVSASTTTPIDNLSGLLTIQLVLSGGNHGITDVFSMDNFILKGFIQKQNKVYNCNEVFANYMNEHTGFSYTAGTYLSFLDSCSLGLRLPLHKYDATTGCDTARWVSNYDAQYLQVIPLSQAIQNSSFNSVTVNGRHHGVEYYDTLCFRPFVMESRFKIPRPNLSGSGSLLEIQFNYMKNGVFRRASFAFDFFPDHTNCYFNHDDSVGLIGPVPKTLNFDDWTTIRVEVTAGRYKMYLNDQFIMDVPHRSYDTFIGFYYAPYVAGLSVDWVSFQNEFGSTTMFEDFNTCDSLSQINTNPCQLSDKKLCNNYSLAPFVSNSQTDPCDDIPLLGLEKGTLAWQHYTDSILNDFDRLYLEKCMAVANVEQFSVTHPVAEYHYTLYYYDRAGNLVQTVPPAGVNPDFSTTWTSQVTAARSGGAHKPRQHNMVTRYWYNSLNQVKEQATPDASTSKFWYDRLGRLVLSQNAKQAAQSPAAYSYTRYDAIGRIIEVGQKQNSTSVTQQMSRNSVSLEAFINYANATYPQKEVTRTVYDVKGDLNMGNVPAIFTQAGYTLRNRVSYTQYFDSYAYSGSVINYMAYSSATYYNYDIHGNVNQLLNHYNATPLGIMPNNLNAFKVLEYDYDLISGKVNKVSYQRGYADQFYHRYEYDAENRITDVYTTTNPLFLGNNLLEDHDAQYSYYRHGPLARVILGTQQVQGVDYAYTLQGWLKGVNATALDPAKDMGRDGAGISPVARDAFAFSLDYRGTGTLGSGDYTPIGGSSAQPFADGSAGSGADFRALYNGNIASMSVSLTTPNDPLYQPENFDPLLYLYRYDQLNRLVVMKTRKGLEANSWLNALSIPDYNEAVTYDPNGNIQTYTRNGTMGEYGTPFSSVHNLQMDELTYKYPFENGKQKNNRLRYVHDKTSAGNYAEDIDSQTNKDFATVQAEQLIAQGDDNYQYDQIGNLVKDEQAGIANNEWTVYGKLKKITKSDGTTIEYQYGPDGNRISKTVTQSADNGGSVVTTNYVRDAQGNTLAVYTGKEDHLYLQELDLYGSSRLGLYRPGLEVSSLNTNVHLRKRGNTDYELSNHLGNVLVTIGDRKKPVMTGGVIGYFIPDIRTMSDYYPFGMPMPGRQYAQPANSIRSFGSVTANGFHLPQDLVLYPRTRPLEPRYVAGRSISIVDGFDSGEGEGEFTVDNDTYDGSNSEQVTLASAADGYRYGFNGKENDNEVKGTGNQQDYGMRIYDPRLGRFLSVDPLSSEYPWYTPYQFAGNKPVLAVDLDGLEEDWMTTQVGLLRQQATLDYTRAHSPSSYFSNKTSSKPPVSVVIHRHFTNGPKNFMLSGPGYIEGRILYGLINDFKIVGSMFRNGHSEATNMIGERVALEDQQMAGLNVGTTLLAPGLEAAASERIFMSISEKGAIAEREFGGNLNEISPNFKTFDNWEPVNGTATSAKTMDLTAPSYQSTSQVSSKLKNYIDDVKLFSYERKNGFTLRSSQIRTRQLGVTFIGDATAAQLDGIKAAGTYAAHESVQFFTSSFNASHIGKGTGYLLTIPTNLNNNNAQNQ